jgi:radical SAM superfamily enzyme YgiQ (UPF0313 family)
LYLSEFSSNELDIPSRPAEDIADARHTRMMAAIAPFAKTKVQKNVTTVDLSYKNRNTKLLLILMPEWAPEFPPFNAARLTAVAKSAGYETNALDLNIKSYRYLRGKVESGELDFDPWDGAREWKWLAGSYFTEIHHYLEPLFNKYIEEIKSNPPNVVGFSMYYCNEAPVTWMAKKLKQEIPGIKIVIGGSNIHNQIMQFTDREEFDYVVNGEGEALLLEILEEIESGKTYEKTQLRFQPEEQRINISNLPLPDYSSFEFNDYKFPNGVCSELSRGCTAKCTFCEETHFWKYRQRMATDILSEVETLYYERGTNVIWFIDSLVNGNLNELRAFCKGVIVKDLKIKWTGYSRCDGRMDYAYYKDLADSGCVFLNYGVESGSQKVLDDMAKGVTISEMEQNFIDGKKTGVTAFTNWLVGFPTEEFQDFADTITFLWRNRNNGIINISAGFGFGLGMTSIVGQNFKRFNLLDHKYLGNWITKDLGLSKFHVLMRMKMFAIFLQQLVTENEIVIPNRPNLPRYHYKIEYNDPTKLNDIEYERFDYNIIKPSLGPFADNLMNEMFVLFRMLWRCRGGFKASVRFDQRLDLHEWGDRSTGPMDSEHIFEIDDDGNWKAKFWVKFTQPSYEECIKDSQTPRGPFFAQDYSRIQLNTAIRARKFAKPEWGDEGRNHEQFMALLSEETELNKTVDLSFEHHWEGSGYWGDNKLYEIEVPSKTYITDTVNSKITEIKLYKRNT